MAAHPEYYREYCRTDGYKERRRRRDAERRAIYLASAEYAEEQAKRLEVQKARLAAKAARLADPVVNAARLVQRRAWGRAKQPARNAKYANDFAFNLQRRMSSAVRRCLRSGAKSGSKWLDLVGYSSDELRTHLERQFLPRMGWHNMPKWHVDHIIPLVSFTFETPEDPEFKAAWALTNLRPIWAAENLRKNAKRVILL
jgi:hypothetical protein